MIRLLGMGGLLTVGVTAVLFWAWGSAAILPGLAFGGLATVIQVVAVAAVRPVRDRPFDEFAKRWGVGMALRGLGVVVFVVAVLADDGRFPPLPSAFGYLGVLIPLLFTETRFLK